MGIPPLLSFPLPHPPLPFLPVIDMFLVSPPASSVAVKTNISSLAPAALWAVCRCDQLCGCTQWPSCCSSLTSSGIDQVNFNVPCQLQLHVTASDIRYIICSVLLTSLRNFPSDTYAYSEHTHTHARMHTHTYIQTRARARTHTHTHTHAHTHAHMHAHTHAHTHTHTHTHTHKHTHTLSLSLSLSLTHTHYTNI